VPPPRGPGRPPAGADVHDRESIIRVAMDVFSRRGYEGTSMRDLAEAAGITAPSIYHHVEGKADLLREGLSAALESLYAVLDEDAMRDGPAVDRLRHVLRRTVEVTIERLPEVALLVRVRGDSEVEKWAVDRRRRFDRSVERVVEQAQAEGDVRRDLDASLVTRLAFGMIVSIVEWYRPEGGRREPEGPKGPRGKLSPGQVARAVEALVLEGLTP